MSEGLQEANVVGRIAPWLRRGASAFGYWKPVAKAAWANKRGTGLGLLAVLVVGRLRKRFRPRREETLPAERVWGRAVTTWANVYERLLQFAPAWSTEYAKAQAAALEAWCGGDPDFGYLLWSGNHVDIVVVKGDRFQTLEVKKDSGDVWSTSALVSRISRIETTDTRDGNLRLDIARESQGWFWEAQDPEAREALSPSPHSCAGVLER